MRYAIYGDPHGTYDGSQGGLPSDQIHPLIVQKILSYNPDGVFALGDHIHAPTPTPCWSTFEQQALPLLDCNYWYTKGNHDNGDGVQAYIDFWNQHNPLPSYYTVDTPYAGFVVLTVNNPNEAPPSCDDYSVQQQFLTDSLNTFSKKSFRFVLFHRPPYTTGIRGSDICARQAFGGIIDQGKTTAVLNGHVHAYERFKVNEVQYIVSGGAGGFPHPLDSSPETPFLIPLRQAMSSEYHYMTLELQASWSKIRVLGLDDSLIDQVDFTATIPPQKGTRVKPIQS